MRKADLLLAPVGEAFLILIAGLAGWLTHQPLIFASLGPTAYELIETPHRRSARPWSIFAGHGSAVVAAYVALFLTAAWKAAPVSPSGVPLPRVWAAVLAAGLTVLMTLLLRAGQPAALSTTLLIALGMMQTTRDAVIIMAAVLLMMLVGEPLRRLRLSAQEAGKNQQTEQGE